MNNPIPQSPPKIFDAESFERWANACMQANLEHARKVRESLQRGDEVIFAPEGVRIKAAGAQGTPLGQAENSR